MTCCERIESLLRANDAPYTLQPHPLAFTAQAVADSTHIASQMMVKVVIVVADGELLMLALPTSRRVDLADLSTLLDAREVRLASESEMMAALPDCEIGATPPFGNLYNLPVYADQSLADDAVIFFQAGSHTLAMSMAYADFVRIVKPSIASFTYQHRRPTGAGSEDVREMGGW